jgi:hypothetical protein
MKNILVAMGALASVVVLSGNAWRSAPGVALGKAEAMALGQARPHASPTQTSPTTTGVAVVVAAQESSAACSAAS